MKLQRAAVFGLVLALGSGAWAQDATEEATPQASTPDASEAAPEAVAEESGETTPTEDEAPGLTEGDAYIAQRFQDWVLSCVYTGTGNDPCRFIQILNNGEGGRVAQVSIVPLPPGRGVAAAAIVETPLGTLLRVPRNADELSQPGGLRIRVDGGEVRVFQFTFCAEGGCVAEIGMEPALVEAFKRGNTANITIWSVDDPATPVELQLSLSGFTAGFNRVAELSGATEEQ